MIQYKNNIVQHGGFILQLVLILVFLTVSLCSSCACCNWPADLDTFLGGTFKSLKFNPFGDMTKGFGDFGKMFKF
jgi:hypothetical protein